MKVQELFENVKEVSHKTKRVFAKLAKLVKTEPLKKNFIIGDSGDFGAISASEITNVDHGLGMIVTDESGKVREIFLFDEDIKRWVHIGKWDTYTASELIKFGRRLDDDWGWVEISLKNNKLLKEE